jgi:hypothetical protein
MPAQSQNHHHHIIFLNCEIDFQHKILHQSFPTLTGQCDSLTLVEALVPVYQHQQMNSTDLTTLWTGMLWESMHPSPSSPSNPMVQPLDL